MNHFIGTNDLLLPTRLHCPLVLNAHTARQLIGPCRPWVSGWKDVSSSMVRAQLQEPLKITMMEHIVIGIEIADPSADLNVT